MTATGIIRRVDDLGRIVIPKEVRRRFGIIEGTAMELFISDEGLMLKKYLPENELLEMTKVLMEFVEDGCVDLGAKKTGDIRRHIREITKILKEDK